MSLAKDLDYAENSVPIITQLSLEISPLKSAMEKQAFRPVPQTLNSLVGWAGVPAQKTGILPVSQTLKCC
ncbi:MAG: hypothetical protein U7126_06040 [Microcoleus sp.]